jgi:hypothetical protein
MRPSSARNSTPNQALHPRGVHRLADLLPPAPDRDDGRQRRGAAAAARRRCGRAPGGTTPAPRPAVLLHQRDLRRSGPANIPTPETYRGTSPAPVRGPATTSPSASARRCASTSPRARVSRSRSHGPSTTTARAADRRPAGPPDFARDVLAGRDIVLLSDGSATRTFCYVADAVDGYYRILLTGRPGEPYNIGTDRPRSRCASWPTGGEHRPRAHRLRRAGRRRTSDDPEYLTDNPNRRCPVIDKARDRARLRARGRPRRRAGAGAALVPRRTGG